MAAVAGLGSWEQTCLCSWANRKTSTGGFLSPKAHLSPQRESGHSHRPALRRTARAARFLRSCWAPHLHLMNVPGEAVPGDGLPRLCSHYTKVASFLSHLESVSQLFRFLHVTLSKSAWLCLVLALPSLNWGKQLCTCKDQLRWCL